VHIVDSDSEIMPTNTMNVDSTAAGELFVAAASPQKKPKLEWSPHHLGPEFKKSSSPRAAATGSASASVAPPNNDLLVGIEAMFDRKLGKLTTDISNNFRDVYNKIEECREGMDIKIEQMRDEAAGLKRGMDTLATKVSQIDDLKSRFDSLSTAAVADFDQVKFKSEVLSELQTLCNGAASSRSAPPVHVEIPVRPRAVSGGSSSGFQAERFIAKKVFLKGWCPFGKDSTHGLSSESAKEMATKLMSSIPTHMREYIDMNKSPYCPFFKNRQISFVLHDSAPDSAAYDISRAWNDKLKVDGVTYKGFQIYAQADASQFVKDRRASVARARGTIETELLGTADGVTLTTDWASGSLYASKSSIDTMIGKWDKQSGWKWLPGLKHVWPLADVPCLDLSMQTY
jgi:hypothetical protein